MIKYYRNFQFPEILHYMMLWTECLCPLPTPNLYVETLSAMRCDGIRSLDLEEVIRCR